MDMAVANLLKHKIRFELVSEHPDNEEHRFYSVGRQYSSRKIENFKSIGSKDCFDLYLYPYNVFYMHVVSTMIEECPSPIDYIEVKTIVRLEDEEYDIRDEHVLFTHGLKKPKDNINRYYKRSVVHFFL